MNASQEGLKALREHMATGVRDSGMAQLPPGGMVPVAATATPVITQPVPPPAPDVASSLMTLSAASNPYAPAGLRMEGSQVAQMMATQFQQIPSTTAIINGQQISIPGDVVSAPTVLQQKHPAEGQRLWIGLLGNRAKKMSEWGAKKGHAFNPPCWFSQAMFPMFEAYQWRPKHKTKNFDLHDKDMGSEIRRELSIIFGTSNSTRILMAAELGNVPTRECLKQLADELAKGLEGDLTAISERQAITRWYPEEGEEDEESE
jgi:hypothetical protein